MLVFVSQDLAMYINEVKRDNETLKKISEFQSSIENLVRSVKPFISFKSDLLIIFLLQKKKIYL